MYRTTRLAALAAIPMTALSLCAMAQPMVKSGYGKYLLQIADTKVF